ncbi:VOC family protein [Streptomyces sp. NPDC101150]|uniref:VOC family protein n=1 Tax=Streptomyces sp. NPDC101150 TaxID=3366114 RepID=UPI0037F4D84E
MTGVTTGAPTVFPALLYRDARAAIRQLTEAFGFVAEAVYDGPDGMVAHAELSYGNGRVMLGSKGHGGAFDEAMADAGPCAVYVVVEDTDVHCARAEAAGAEILMPPADQDYGSRDYMARDREGNIWSFGTYRPGAPS